MGITATAFERHANRCESIFNVFQKYWHRGLYMYEPIENALAILKDGRLISREHAQTANAIINDIAPGSIIMNTDAAHSKIRLYFRPRNPTQFHIEGIRSPDEYYQNKHGGFLVLFVFDARTLLTSSHAGFSDGNLQSGESQIMNGDAQFDELNFRHIYHDNSLPADEQLKRDITRKKCSEVLLDQPLELDTPVLKCLFVRTDADASTLKFLLNSQGSENFAGLVRKAPDNGYFFHYYNALDYIDTTPNRIQFVLKGTRTSREVNFKLQIHDESDDRRVIAVDDVLTPGMKYYVDHGLQSGSYLAKATIEDCFAHEAILNI